MRLLDPITITGADFDVALAPDSRAARPPGWVRVANESQYALQLTGLGADAHWLQPWSTDVYAAWGATSMHVHPVQLVSPLPPAPFATLLVTLADEVETIPGVYPSTLDRQSASYGQQVRISLVSAASGSVVNGPVVGVPLGIQSIGFEVENGTPVNVFISGSPTGTSYLNELSPIHAPYISPFSVAEDTSAQLTVDNTAGGGVTAVVSMIGYTTLFSYRPPLAPPGAPWQAPRAKLVNSTNTTAATYKNILAAVGAGLQLYLMWARFDIDAVSGGVFAVGTDGLTASVFVINDNGKGPYVLGPFTGGEPQGFNAGLWVFTTNASTVRYHVAYTAG